MAIKPRAARLFAKPQQCSTAVNVVKVKKRRGSPGGVPGLIQAYFRVRPAGLVDSRPQSPQLTVALIRRMPAEEASSLTILNTPRTPVRSTCGPPQISREYIPRSPSPMV